MARGEVVVVDDADIIEMSVPQKRKQKIHGCVGKGKKAIHVSGD